MLPRGELMNSYLLPIADREPLAWILAEQRTAFPAGRAREAKRLERGDRLFLYSTQAAFTIQLETAAGSSEWPS
jgi:hypothetical protein